MSLMSWSSYAREIRRVFDTTSNLGRGNTGTADSYGTDAIFYNPAGVGATGRTFEEISVLSPQVQASDEALDIILENKNYKNIKLSPEETIRTYNKQNLDLAVQNFSGMVMNYLSFGIVNSAKSHIESEINLADPSNSFFLFDVATRNGIILGKSWQIFDSFRIGANLKGLYKVEKYLDMTAEEVVENLATNAEFKSLVKDGNGIGVGGDLGLLYTQETAFVDITYGLTVLDIADTKYRGGSGDQPRKDPQMINFGVALKTEIDKQTFTETIDIDDLAFAQKQSFFNRLHMGLRWDYRGYAGMQVGINQGYATAGIFLRYKIIGVEYARYGSELGKNPGDKSSLRHSVMLRLGWVL